MSPSRPIFAINLVQFAYNFAVVGPIMFVPLLAQSLGATPTTVGLVVAAYQGVIFLSSALFGRLADLRGHRLFIVTGLLLASGAFFAHRYINTILALFIVRALGGLALGIFPAAVIAYASHHDSSLGRFSAVGALGWGLGSLAAGLIAVYNDLFLISAAIFLVAAIIALVLIPETRARVNQPFFSLHLLLRNWRIYVSFFLRHAGAAGIWAIFPLFLAQLGASKFWIGVIYSLNAFGQFAVMPFLDRYRSSRLMQVGFVGSVLTFIGFALCRNYRQIIPLQATLAVSWSCLYVGSLKYLVEHNPERSSAIGLFNSTMSFSGIVGALLGGALAGMGLPAVMIAAAVMAVLGVLVFRF